MAALTEQKSEHPLGKAILNAYESQGGTYKESVDFRLFAGQGVSANIEGHTVLVGKEDFMQSQNINISTCIEKSKAELDKGATIVYVAADGKLAGFISLRDIVRHDAKETLDKLKAAVITPMLLTGDNTDMLPDQLRQRSELKMFGLICCLRRKWISSKVIPEARSLSVCRSQAHSGITSVRFSLLSTQRFC